MNNANDQIAKCRDQIDIIDDHLIQLLGLRFELVRKIGEFKADYDLPVVDQERKLQVSNNWHYLGKKSGLSEWFIASLYKLVHDYAIKEESD
jgi:chorismate mutase